MKRYITLLRFTDSGAKNLKDSPARAQAFTEKARAAGVTVEGQYWTAGAYDGVLILSANDESTVFRCLAELAAQGNVRTETFPAVDAAEFSKIVGG